MKIVILDAHCANPGDMDWGPLQGLGELEIYPRTSSVDCAKRIKDADVVLTNKVVLDAATIQQAEQLKYIGVMATGYNVVDIEAARERNIPVTNVPAYSAPFVAQHVFALIMALCNKVHEHDVKVKAGNWVNCEDFCFTTGVLTELSELTLGLVGYGDISQRVARIARAMDMKVLVHTRTDPADGTPNLTLEELLPQCDVLSLHCPLTDQTHEMINAERLKLMKNTALLINTARGPVIHEADLRDALDQGVIAGAGLDVLSTEPPAADNPLLEAKHCVITPHIAWASQASRKRLIDTLYQNLKAWKNQQPINVVN